MRALQPGRVEVVGLPAEGRAQAVERTSEVLGLGASQGRFPRAVAVGHGVTVDPTADKLSPEAPETMALNYMAARRPSTRSSLRPRALCLIELGEHAELRVCGWSESRTAPSAE
jgi:hypothetical protein